MFVNFTKLPMISNCSYFAPYQNNFRTVFHPSHCIEFNCNVEGFKDQTATATTIFVKKFSEVAVAM